MKKPLIVAIVVALVVVGLAYFFVFANEDDEPEAQNTTQTDTTTSTEEDTLDEEENTDEAPTSEVTIDNRDFGPNTITVKKGTTVTWTNNDDMSHDVTPDTETADFQQSDMLSNGDIYTVTFNTPGTYTYHCTPHPDMTGTVIVTE